VGGISGISGLEIGEVFVSGFKDDRPAVELVAETLRAKGIAPTIGLVGTSGQLGGFSWEILAPSRDASEARDSNDASLVVVFENSDRVILTLGDLGEPGQLRIQASGRMNRYIDNREMILKVSHHGSADQSLAFHQLLKPDIALISVGENDYGHPSESAIQMLESLGAKVFTTLESGHISFSGTGSLSYSLTGKLSV
jgi:competence protein ComEC